VDFLTLLRRLSASQVTITFGSSRVRFERGDRAFLGELGKHKDVFDWWLKTCAYPRRDLVLLSCRPECWQRRACGACDWFPLSFNSEFTGFCRERLRANIIKK